MESNDFLKVHKWNTVYLIVNLREAGLTKIEEEKWPILEDRA